MQAAVRVICYRSSLDLRSSHHARSAMESVSSYGRDIYLWLDHHADHISIPRTRKIVPIAYRLPCAVIRGASFSAAAAHLQPRPPTWKNELMTTTNNVGLRRRRSGGIARKYLTTCGRNTYRAEHASKTNNSAIIPAPVEPRWALSPKCCHEAKVRYSTPRNCLVRFNAPRPALVFDLAVNGLRFSITAN